MWSQRQYLNIPHAPVVYSNIALIVYNDTVANMHTIDLKSLEALQAVIQMKFHWNANLANETATCVYL